MENALKFSSKEIAYCTLIIVCALSIFPQATSAQTIQWSILGSANGGLNMITNVLADGNGSIYTVDGSNVPVCNSASALLERRSALDGSITWSRPIPDVCGGLMYPTQFALDSTGIYVGYSHPAAPVIYVEIDKYDFNGNLLWTYTDPGDATFSNGLMEGLATDGNGGIYVAGQRFVGGSTEGFVQKQSATDGNTVLWSVFLPVPASTAATGIAVNEVKTSIYVASTYYPGGGASYLELDRLNVNTGALEMRMVGTSPYIGTATVRSVGTDAYVGYDDFNIPALYLSKITETGVISWTQSINLPAGTVIAGIPSGGMDTDASGVYYTYSPYKTGLSSDAIYIEKRDLASGSLLWQEISNPTPASDYGSGLSISGTDMFLSGLANASNSYNGAPDQSYLEKRAPVTANTAPTAPVLGGPTTGVTNTPYTFTAQSSDPDGNNVRYGFDWNMDGTVDTWTSLVASGVQGSASDQWPTTGTKTFQVLAQDDQGANSGWSPYTIAISNPLTVSCTVSPNTGTGNTPFIWTASASGGTGPYTYAWTWNPSAPSSVSYPNPPGDKSIAQTTFNVGTQTTETGYVTVTDSNTNSVQSAPCVVEDSSGTPLTPQPSPVGITVYPTPTASLLNNGPIDSGQKATLTWTSSNTTYPGSYCTGTGFGTGNLATSGTAQTPPLTSDTSYSITCTNPGGTSAPAPTTVKVNPSNVTINANPQRVASNSPVTITWNSTNTTSCKISSVPSDPNFPGTSTTTSNNINGMQSSPIKSQTVFTANCTASGGGTVSRSVIVNILPVFQEF